MKKTFTHKLIARSIVTQNLKTFTHKLETKDSKTQKSVRTVPVTDEDESLPSVPLTQASRTADTRQDDSRQYDFFQSQGTFSKFLRSDFFKKPYHLRAGLAANVSRSQLELNDFDAHISTYFIIHPESTFKKCWDVFEYIITVLQFFLLPLFLGFVELSIGLNYLTIVTTIVYTLSIFITLRTGIYKQYVLIMDRSKIEAEYYNSGRFLYDVITAFPFVFVVDALAKDPQSNIAWRLLCFLNATRALRIAFGPESFWFPYVIKKIRLKYKINGATVGIVKVLGFMFIYWYEFWAANL